MQVNYMIKAIVQIVARNPPSILLAYAGLLAITGQTKDAYNFLYTGIFLQIAWLVLKFGRH